MNTGLFRIAAVQMVSGPDVSENLAAADAMIGEAVAQGARLWRRAPGWWRCPSTFR